MDLRISISYGQSSFEFETSHLYTRTLSMSDLAPYKEVEPTVAELGHDGSLDDLRVPLREGDVVFERFEILEQIGAGGDGQVYRVQDRRGGYQVALKLLRREAHLRRFKSEYRLHRRFFHRNLLSPGELIIVGDRAGITMPYLPQCRSLNAALEQLGPEERETASRRWLGQLASALTTLHARGIVHCDIKPANVLIDERGEVRLIDLGASFVEGKAWKCRAGTPRYLAPEVECGRPPSFASDWYSLGVILCDSWGFGAEFEHLPSGVRDSEIARLARGLLEIDPQKRPCGDEVLKVLGVPPSRAAPSFSFVGRATEMERLMTSYRQSIAGKTTFVQLRGEAGIGKTRLLREFEQTLQAETHPPLVLGGTCSRFESLPFNMFDEAFENLVDVILEQKIELPPETQEALFDMADAFSSFMALLPSGHEDARVRGPIERRESVLRGVRALLLELTRQRPLVFILDQLMRADADSARFLVDLVTTEQPLALLVVGASRSEFLEESAHLLGVDKSGVSLKMIHIGELSSGDVAALTRDWEPLDRTELSLNPRRLMGQLHGLRLWDGLPPGALRVARFLAIANQPLSRHVVSRALGGPTLSSDIVRCLEEQGLLHQAERGGASVLVPPDHETRRLLICHLSPDELRELHLSLVDVLGFESSADHALLAEHLFAASEVESACFHAERVAAGARSRGEFLVEIQWLERAQKALDPQRSEHQKLYREVTKNLDRARNDLLRSSAQELNTGPSSL